MATPEETGSDTSSNDPHNAPATGTGMKGKLVALAIVLIIVLAECAVAILVFPSANDAASLTQAMLANPDTQADDAVAEPPAEEDRNDENALEMDLGEFDVSSYQPLSNTTLRISVHLFAIVATEDESQVLEMLEAKRQRMREQVLVILRSAELTDLTDAGLGLIKRRILEKTNRTFGEPLLHEIIFSDFSFMEQ